MEIEVKGLPVEKMAQMSDELPEPRYRYCLGRRWGPGGKPFVNFIMLNPSTADEQIDDPTIRRCIGFAKSWGYEGLIVTNLFALRATDPARLKRSADPIGPLNDRIIAKWADPTAGGLVVCAWGAHGKLFGRDRIVTRALRTAGVRLHAIALTGAGAPSHPLYLPGNLPPAPWGGV